MNDKPKLCYILPRYARDDSTHFAHIADFLSGISQYFDVALLIENGEMPKDNFGCSMVQKLWFSFLPFRYGELKLRVLALRLRGYRNVYVHYSFTAALAASIVMRLTGGKVLYWNCGEPWKYRQNFLRRLFEKLAYRAVTALVTGTEGMKKQYSAVYGIPESRIRVMPNWISADRFSPVSRRVADFRGTLEISQDARVVLFVHRLSRRKGAHHLPAILDALRDENIIMIAAGDGPERGRIEARMRELNLSEKVRLIGDIPNHTLPEYYALADALIMPSEEEGFPRVLLEAMAMGVPCAAFGVGGVPEIVPEVLRPYIAEPENLPDLIGKLKNILGLPEDKKQAVREEEKRWAARFELKNVIPVFRQLWI